MVHGEVHTTITKSDYSISIPVYVTESNSDSVDSIL